MDGFQGEGRGLVADFQRRIGRGDLCRREIPGVRNVSPEVRTSRQVIAGNMNTATEILGTSTEYLTIRSWGLKDGSFFTEQDIQ